MLVAEKKIFYMVNLEIMLTILTLTLKVIFLSDVQLCGKCGYYIEDTKHYFTKCPYFKKYEYTLK